MKNLLFFTFLLCSLFSTRISWSQDYIQIKNAWQKDGKNDYNIHIQTPKVNAGPTQSNWYSAYWQLEPVTGTSFYRIRNRWKKDGKTVYYLHTEHGPLEAGGIAPGWHSAQWALEPVAGTNFFRIRNRWRKDQYLHIENPTLESGAIQPNWRSALWELEGFKPQSVAGSTPDAPVTSTPASTGKMTFRNTSSKNKVISIYKETMSREPEFIIRLNPGNSHTVDCQLHDVFSFKVSGFGTFEVPNYVVKRVNATYDLEIGQQYANVKTTYKRIPNAMASRHSFDILKTDPIFIDYTADRAIEDAEGKRIGYGGMRKRIFETLGEEDVDWEAVDGDYALKNHFSLMVLADLREEEETKMFYNASAFKKSFSGNIGVSGGGKGAKAGGSASFNYTSSKSSSQKEIYTYSRATAKVYDISLQKEHIRLTTDFKNAVKRLPKPAQTPTNLAAAKRTSGFNQYQSFIRSWGTHYPTNTAYGGVKVAVMSFTEKEFKESKEWGVGVKGELEKKVKTEGGFSTSQSKSFEELNSNSKKMARYKGGMGSGDGWSVDMDNSVPIAVQLSRLYELLDARYFRDETTANDLNGRKAMLRYALEDYIGAATDEGQLLTPKYFQISNVQWKMVNPEDGTTTPAIFGTVSIEVAPTASGRAAYTSKTVFNRTEKPGSRVIADKGYIEKCPGEILYAVPASSGRQNLDLYQFVLRGKLYDYDKSSDNDLIGNKSTTMSFSQIGTSPQTITLRLKSDDSDIDVSARVQQINPGFDDFR